MEKHILTYTSDGTDKTAVAITKIRNSGTDIIGEIVYTGTDEGAVRCQDFSGSFNVNGGTGYAGSGRGN